MGLHHPDPDFVAFVAVPTTHVCSAALIAMCIVHLDVVAAFISIAGADP